MTKPLRLLLVEDSEDDAMLVVRELRKNGYAPEPCRVQDARAMSDALKDGPWDLVLSDSSMPHFSLMAALGLLRSSGLDIPFIIVSGTVGEEAAVAAMRAGASDFVLKGNLARLPAAIDRELRESQARRHARAELSASEERYRLLFDRSPLPTWVFALDTLRFLTVNEAAVRHYGWSREEFAAMTIEEIRPREDLRELHRDIAERSPGDVGSTWRHRKKDGSIIVVEVKAHDIVLEGREARLVVINDVTARKHAEDALKKTEEQLRQTQKMEAVGRLAGGVAHDFNNLLSVVLSYADLTLAELGPESPLYEDVDEIRKAGKRAAELTRQLLMFSRQQAIETKVLDPAEVLTSMDKMLRRMVGEDVELVSRVETTIGRVKLDRGHLEQVVMNLVVNARDAMPTGGKLSIEAKNVTLDEPFCAEHIGVKPGDYVLLAVKDSGVGMDEATRSRIFEPFFSTKERGKGTGLGLSTVFGIVQQSGGCVDVESAPGKGATFKVYLPRVDEALQRVVPTAPPKTLRGSETILLVEDEDQVRAVARDILKKQGYDVIEASDAAEAIAFSESHHGAIHLLVTDVVMPKMSGPELARKLAAARPDMKILCVSGYTDDSNVRHGLLESKMAFLQKPITPDTLAREVRAVLDARDGASRASRASNVTA